MSLDCNFYYLFACKQMTVCPLVKHGSHPITEVKQHQAGLVDGWVTILKKNLSLQRHCMLHIYNTEFDV
jgi:hypothetical protein